MTFFPNRQTFLQIGPLHIQWYAIFIIAGALLGFYLAVQQLKKVGVSKEMAEDFFIYALLIGIVGARVWYVVFMYQDLYAHRPFWDMFKIWEGGLAIQGGLIAAIAFGFYYFWKKKVPLMRTADAIMPCVLVAQSIGRWGNFMNQEAHGEAVGRQFLESLHLPNFIIEGMNINGVYYQPTFLYESLGDLLVFLILVLVVARIYTRHGELFCGYFIGYGIVRIIVEGMRTDSLMLGPLRMAQVTSLVGIVAAVGVIFYLHRKGQKVTEETRLWTLTRSR